MTSPCIVFRADASLTIGSGHVMRCLTLADHLAGRFADIVFVSRAQKGDLIGEIERRGYNVLLLPTSVDLNAPLSEEADASAFITALDQLEGTGTKGNVADWVIVDSYVLGQAWERAARTRTTALMAIDDLANRAHDVDILLDQNLIHGLERRYAELLDTSCMQLLGPRYALLAQKYATVRPLVHRTSIPPERILVYFGAADTRLALLTAQALLALPEAFRATIVLDESNVQYPAVEGLVADDERLKLIGRLPDLASAMVASDLFIGASGTTSWERLSLGLKAIVVTMAENQIPLAVELARHNFIHWLGDTNAVELDGLVAAITEALSTPIEPQLAEAMMAVVDGRGAERVCDALLYNGSEGVTMRPVAATDKEMMLAWANDAGTRRHAFSTATIHPDVHDRWFAKRTNNPDVVFLVAETPHGLAFGQVRFERQLNGCWEISYLVGPGFRGRGLARKLLSTALEKLDKLHPSSVVKGLVRLENRASMRVFEALGFTSKLASEPGAVQFTRQL